MFRLLHDIGLETLAAFSPSVDALGSLDMTAPYTGLSSYEALNAIATIQGVSDAAITVRLTFEGTGVDDLIYDINIVAGRASSNVTINRSMVLAEYQSVTVQAWHDTEPESSATGLNVMLTTQYPPTTLASTGGGLFSILDIVAAKRPDSPIVTGAYWDDVRVVAEGIVQDITRRQLAVDDYTDKGNLIKVEMDSDTRYVWYLREPTGTALTFANFTTLTLDGTDVATGDVIREPGRLVFDSPGEIVAAYPGGFLRSATAKAVIRQAVIEAMHIIHNRGTAAGYTGVSQGGGQSILSAHDNAYAQVRAMLAKYTAYASGVYAASPSA